MGIIVGTAGHIDHGKSQLVKYLTGSDPDRLKEEKERGITIELGYVFMPVSGGGLISFIDVPGHENFIRQMVAGTTTVDCFLLVVAADEGIMPQTREHLDILRLLNVTSGLVAITKCDLVDGDMQDLVEEEIMDLFQGDVFQNTPVHRVSSLDGSGMEELRNAIIDLAGRTGQRKTGGRFRLDIDRVFVLEGFGTIVAGTAISGTVTPGQELELQPGGGKYRVREIRVNSMRDIEAGSAGDRIAINLVGLERRDVERGCCLAEPGYINVLESMDTQVNMIPGKEPLRRYQRVRFHTGTAEVMARAIPVEGDLVSPGDEGFVHFQLENPVAALPGDRFVIRSYSPIVTIGGGTILETGTRKVRRKYRNDRVAHLEVLQTGETDDIVHEMAENAGYEGVTAEEAAESLAVPENEVQEVFRNLSREHGSTVTADGSSLRLYHETPFEEACGLITKHLQEHHSRDPMSLGIQPSEISRILKGRPQRFIKTVLEQLTERRVIEKTSGWLALAGRSADIPKEFREPVRDFLAAVDARGPKGMPEDEAGSPDMLRGLVQRGLVHHIEGGILVTHQYAEKIFRDLEKTFGENGFTLAQLRDLLEASRKYALAWAQLFDGLGWTAREGDIRTIRRD